MSSPNSPRSLPFVAFARDSREPVGSFGAETEPPVTISNVQRSPIIRGRHQVFHEITPTCGWPRGISRRLEPRSFNYFTELRGI
ncbi:hypothetical protein CEXT_578791 [Caerostris extrusa]|uniref:Uncharacterized protein n=1 Tax=Caerostris extrusa TaxID=172846 RepID=A0AAV4QWS9_CAEEX|nr:hypothetical protein CEXT_578791 [Caerostris extrusa]